MSLIDIEKITLDVAGDVLTLTLGESSNYHEVNAVLLDETASPSRETKVKKVRWDEMGWQVVIAQWLDPQDPRVIADALVIHLVSLSVRSSQETKHPSFSVEPTKTLY